MFVSFTITLSSQGIQKLIFIYKLSLHKFSIFSDNLNTDFFAGDFHG